MEKTTKKRIKRYVFWACAGLLVVLLAAMPLMAKNAEDEGPKASILSGQVKTGSVSTVLRGGGKLEEEEAVEATVPAGVKLTEFLVSNGDSVTKGQPLAAVDRVSVMAAITGVQETLEYLSGEIQKASGGQISNRVVAKAGGKVMEVYAKTGDSVQDVMLKHGALAVISLDGLLAVDIQTELDLSAGDILTVKFADGTGTEGRVDRVLGREAVVTIDHEAAAAGETVQVMTIYGSTLGEGVLYVHNAWKATAFSGTVAAVNVREGQQIRGGSTVVTLTDTAYTAEFESLSEKRREYEKLMLELFRLYQDQTLNAPCDGVVAGVDKDSVHLLSDSGEGAYLTLLANAPNGDDEMVYNNFVGMVTAVDHNGWQLLLDPASIPITDYKVLTGISPDPETMTQTARFIPRVPIYELVEEQWQQIGAEQIRAGDVMLFAGDDQGQFVWVVRLSRSSLEQEQPEQSDPSGKPNGGGQMQWPSFGGFTGKVQEEVFELYELEGSAVMTVTPQDSMKLLISLDEHDIAKVSLGQIAQIKVEALKHETFAASVTSIATEATNAGGSSKFQVELTLTRGENMLDGMSASAEIVLSTTEKVLTVPVAALNEAGTKTVVYTSYDKKNGTLGSPVVVETGVSDGENVQILSGLSEGDPFFYAYYDTLELSHTPESGGFSFG